MEDSKNQLNPHQQASYPPQQVSNPPQQVSYPPQQVSYHPQNVSYHPQQVSNPQQVSYPLQQVSQQVSYPPQQVSYPPQQMSNPPQVSYPPCSNSPQPLQCVQAQQPQYGSQALAPPYPQQQYAGNVVAMVNTPQPSTQVLELPVRPRNYIVLSLSVSIVFFFCPLGIAALGYSCQVDSKYDAGQYEEAARASRIALILNIISMVVGFVLTIAAITIAALANN